MQVLIIEDEITAIQKLKTALFKIDPSIEVVAALQSVKESVSWIRSNPTPDLAFVDIQLSDDSSFSLFEKVNVEFPVIFTTAFDQYILKSLEHNAIDYILKPIQESRLEKAIKKVKKLESHFLQHKLGEILNKQYQHHNRSKKRFLVKKGADYLSIHIKDIAYFFTAHKIVFLVDHEGQKFIIDKPLSELEKELDPSKFFRANRKYLIHIESVVKFKSNNGKIALSITPPPVEELMVSKENAPNFRDWISG